LLELGYLTSRIKRKVAPVYTLKANWGIGDLAPLVFTLDTGWRFTSCTICFTTEKEPRYPMNRRLGRPQGQCLI